MTSCSLIDEYYGFGGIHYCSLLSSTTVTLEMVSQRPVSPLACYDHQQIYFSQKYVGLKYRGVLWGGLILTCGTEFSVVFCLLRVVHKFNPKLVIVATSGKLQRPTYLAGCVFYLEASPGVLRAPSIHAVKAKALLLRNDQYLYLQ